MKTRNHKSQIICLCNQVTKDTIEEALSGNSIKDIDEIFDQTQAGVGACGGSCRPLLKKILNYYKDTGDFLEEVPDHRMRAQHRKKKK